MSNIVVQEHLLISGIMCYGGCGKTIEALLNLDAFKQQKLLTPNAQIIIDAEPQTLGVHRLTILIEDEQSCDKNVQKKIITALKEKLNSEFTVLTADGTIKKTNQRNKINLAINLLSFLTIITLSFLFPPSLLLTLSFMSLSFLTTAFTARNYLIDFIKNLRHKQMVIMPTAITLGWLLSLAHALYHAIIMPLTSAFSMVFMSYLMPILLISVINGMDELKRFILRKSEKMQLRGMKSLLPQMAETYRCTYPSDQQQMVLANLEQHPDELSPLSTTSWDAETTVPMAKSALKKGMLITVQRGECFPVDGLLIKGNTLIDASLLTGEPHQMRSPPHSVPAGAINLGQNVLIYAQADSYHSTINRLLFRANRATPTEKKLPSRHLFTTIYTTVIIIGIIAAIMTPLALGLLTLPLLLQNITGILFTICPCTLAIAYQLPKLLSQYQLHQKGVILRNDDLTKPAHTINTVVFDKTGTLTTGNSQVESSDGISNALWQKIYLLEKNQGGEHPLAKAITTHCETTLGLRNGRINDIKSTEIDSKNRGLSAEIQGKQIHIGNLDYLIESGITPPTHLSQCLQQKSALGYTPVYVAEKGRIQGVIFIKHEIRPGVVTALQRLKKEGKKLILLTGDNRLSAMGFNQQNGAPFADEDIHAEQTPADKETFLKKIMQSKQHDRNGTWFIGDGLNDAASARIVSSEGGVSCSITANDKVAYFTDVSLNGSLDYLFQHERINQYVKKNTQQNQGVILFCAIAFLTVIITCSVLGIAAPPLIPLTVMLSAALFSLANSYRIPTFINNALSKKTAIPIDTARVTPTTKETIRHKPFHRRGNHFFPQKDVIMTMTETPAQSDTLTQCQARTTNTMGLPT